MILQNGTMFPLARMCLKIVENVKNIGQERSNLDSQKRCHFVRDVSVIDLIKSPCFPLSCNPFIHTCIHLFMHSFKHSSCISQSRDITLETSEGEVKSTKVLQGNALVKTTKKKVTLSGSEFMVVLSCLNSSVP